MKLDPHAIKNHTEEGVHGDGNGLYLQVAANGTKSWIYRYQLDGRRRSMGLGGYPSISLATARFERNKYRLQVKAGIDPLITKQTNKANQKAEEEKQRLLDITFDRCAEDYIAAKSPEWKNKKHIQQWENTLKTYASPVIGTLSVQHIELSHVLEILNPIWLTKTETATRVRNRMELIIDYSTALKYRSGENPARWRGNLDAVLPRPSKIMERKHHAALPYDEIGPFMVELSKAEGLAAKALILTILTATRTSETLNAEWTEINFDKFEWIIPKARMKSGKQHRIPLSDPSIDLLTKLKSRNKSKFLFPGAKRGKPLSNLAMLMTLRRMERGDLTVHGFRSTFRDWIAEKTNYPQRVAETALAHQLKDASEAAYQRGDLLEKRTALMQDWAGFCLQAENTQIVSLDNRRRQKN